MHPPHPRPRRPLRRRRSTSPSAPARPCVADRRDRQRDRRGGRRERDRPEHRRHRHVRLGLGEDDAGVAHVDDAERHGHRARPGCSSTSAASSSTTSATPRCSRDLQLVARRGNQVDVALVPIGGHYTMDRFDAVTAVEFVQPDQVIPCHYDTFPPIETDAAGVQGRRGARRLRRGHRARARARPTRSGDARDRPDRGRARGDADARRRLADVEGVAEAYSVTGEWDFVAIVRVREPEGLAPLVTERLAQLRGHPPHAHDGRLRGLLQARPRGAVLDRRLSGRARPRPRAPPPDARRPAARGARSR